ncbi:MAG: UDP-3-O-(3-hydroxymyristoyl)glucosamine N-acyltransferase [Candidatus Zixiibacteriota bacterium]
MTNSSNSPGYTLAALATAVGAELHGDGAIVITGAAPIETAGADDICFVANPAYKKYITTTNAAAIVLDHAQDAAGRPALRHANPYLTFAHILDLLYPDPVLVTTGVHKSAVISANVAIEPSAAVGPFCEIQDDVTIGKGSRLVSSVFVGKGCRIGDNCLIHPGVRILHGTQIGNNVILHAGTVLGPDGFGFAPSDAGLKKIKQVGWVEIGDDVEIGANCTIDRGALGPTRIGQGTKIDNLVQIAHNVETGRHCIIVSQVGISGSTKLGNGVVLAGQVGLVGHIEIGDGVKVGAQSGVHKSIPPGKEYFGYPAREAIEAMKISAALNRLPELLRRVRALEEKLDK